MTRTTPRRRRALALGLTALLASAAGATPALGAPAAPAFSSAVEPLASYDPQKTCSTTVKIGTDALRSLVTQAYRGTGDSGIVRSCDVGGTSEHKEGRAWDWRVNAFDPAQDAAAHDLFDWLLATDATSQRYALARRLGIMYMIYNGHMWSAYNASAGWRPYTGANPHTDHVHISLSWAGADRRTSYWESLAPPTPTTGPAPSPTPTPTPTPSSPSTPAAPGASPVDTRWSTDSVARALLGEATGPEVVDGVTRWRPYTRGRIYWTAATGAKYVLDPLLRAYLRVGGHSGVGAPVSDQAVTADGVGRSSSFAGGTTVYWTPATGAHAVGGGIKARWQALGGETTLGYPTTDELSTPDGVGRYNDFSRGGSIYWTPATDAHAIGSGIKAHWKTLGAERTLGYPTTDELSTSDGVGRYNDFTLGGSIYWTPATDAHAIGGGIKARWKTLGAERTLGYPTTDELSTSDGVGRYNDFTLGGSIYWTPATDAHAIGGGIKAHWKTLGAERTLGYPTTDELGTPDGVGRYNEFTLGGSIYWTPATDAHAIGSGIKARWKALGGGRTLGYPTTDELSTPDGVARYNDFTLGSSIYWTPATDAHAIGGGIKARWKTLGAGRTLGYPTTDELGTPDGVGRYNDFTLGSSIYWTPITDAHAIGGGIKARWKTLGGERTLGYPTTDELGTPDGVGRYNDFARGSSVYWTPATDAHAVSGAARDRWQALGRERSYLGYPVRSQYAVPAGQRTDFARGSITVTPDGVVDTAR